VFSLVTYRQNWGDARVYYHDDSGRLRSIPAGWTDVVSSDPFVVVSAGRSWFRVEELVVLASLVEALLRDSVGDGGTKHGEPL
jgi:hypothetical protein